ncbi:MAG: ribbon-helix-helix domain-containing protein [Nocardioides sp.]
MASATWAMSSPNCASWYSATTKRAARRSDLPDTSSRLRGSWHLATTWQWRLCLSCISYSIIGVEKIQGKPVTEQGIRDWADQAERGYDVDRLRMRGRKPAGEGPGQVVPVRIDATLLAALAERAERDHVSRSEAIRAAIRAYVA